MRKKLLKVVFLFTFINTMQAQQITDSDVKKSNPIIYAEMFGGFSAIKDFGVAGGLEMNYQYKKSLFSFRFTDITGYRKEEIIPIFPVPIYSKTENIQEYAVLYGVRWVKSSHSYSLSTGVSYNNLELEIRDSEGNRYFNYKNFYGVPFEANFKWFYPKRRDKIIFNALIPSVGLKIFGNIAQQSFVGAAVSVGFGFSKQY